MVMGFVVLSTSPSFSLFSHILMTLKAKMHLHLTRYEAFTAVNIQVEVFWVVTLCSVVVWYQRFRGP